MRRDEVIAVARGDAPGDILFANGRIVNTLTAEIEEADVVVAAGRVAGIGPGYEARETVDLAGAYLLPAFIDGHTHIESSHLWVTEYARTVVPHGTAAAVTDLHEVANVAGLPGVRLVMSAAKGLPLELFLMAPSCVPATTLETAGGEIGVEEIRQALGIERTIGLGEVMDFPGVIQGNPNVLERLDAVEERPVDGHAPGVTGRALNAYLAAGPRTDHESTALEEGREKLRRGIYLMIREGTTEKNLEELLPLVTDKTASRCLFVVDDRSCEDLERDGDVDAIVRKAIALGLDPVRAVQLATINPALCFGLQGLGAIAPGYRAHFIVTDDVERLSIRSVYFDGGLVAEDGDPLFSTVSEVDPRLTQTVNVGPIMLDSFAVPTQGRRYPVIEAIPGQILTGKRIEEVRVEQGRVVADIGRDLLKLAVVERHHGSGRVGVGLVSGFGLKRGALASSYAHDSHNIIVVGVDDGDMLAAVREIERMQGGLVVIEGGQPVASLRLPVLGLMSTQPASTVAETLARLNDAARSLGATVEEPFAVLSFLALPVIPSLKLTDKGLVDVERGAFFDLDTVQTTNSHH